VYRLHSPGEREGGREKSLHWMELPTDRSVKILQHGRSALTKVYYA
jgi:hypothetical protein